MRGCAFLKLLLSGVSCLQVYDEKEALYPPLTYLRPVKMEKETLAGQDMLVATVEPVFM